MYIDIHCHLDLLKNPEAAIKKAIAKKVKLILTAGVDKKTNRASLALAKKHPEVKAALGVYPIDALKLSPKKLEEEFKFIKDQNPAAIGEVGLDYKEPKETERQISIFRKFITLAIKLDKPIIVHSRKAEADCIGLLSELKAKKVIMHCFSGNHKLVQKIRDHNWYLSIPANVTTSHHFQKIVEETPLTQLFCETDSPFLHPHKLPDNEPVNVIESYKKIAKIKKLSLKEVEKQIEDNYNSLF